ncbi:DUF7118 family protein [Halorussus amylolyticus]|uniref:DUF7118 family protein n=1 Tax=Halorussus amylolyticus TaxID=1126242 RepID=UPI001047D3C4|nr:hypothetical protein [Halorussus amylolyticus]
MSENVHRRPDAVADLEAADAAYRDVVAEIESHGEENVEAVADAYDRATTLLARYEAQATGTGRSNFQKFVEFKSKFSSLVEGLDDDLPARDAFEAAGDRVDKNRLNESDFERARDDLEPAKGVADLLDDRREARSRYRKRLKETHRALEAAEADLADRERLVELGAADLDAPVEEIRDPIESYNDAVNEAFAEFRRESSARAVLDFVATTRSYPLVEFDRPPENLREYVENREVGEEPLTKLLKYARYSNSKLSHYVGDPGALKRAVATNETYLERLDADPLELDWPPRSATDLKWRVEELVSVVGRFAPEAVVADLREVQRAVHDEARFERLRTAAEAEAQLSDAEREKVENGEVTAEIEDLKARISALEDSLEAYPDR